MSGHLALAKSKSGWVPQVSIQLFNGNHYSKILGLPLNIFYIPLTEFVFIRFKTVNRSGNLVLD